MDPRRSIPCPFVSERGSHDGCVPNVLGLVVEHFFEVVLDDRLGMAHSVAKPPVRHSRSLCDTVLGVHVAKDGMPEAFEWRVETTGNDRLIRVGHGGSNSNLATRQPLNVDSTRDALAQARVNPAMCGEGLNDASCLVGNVDSTVPDDVDQLSPDVFLGLAEGRSCSRKLLRPIDIERQLGIGHGYEVTIAMPVR